MKFIEEKSVIESYRSVVAAFRKSVELGWLSAPFSRAFIYVRPDDEGRDLIVFDIEDTISNVTTVLEIAPDEAPADVQRRSHQAWADMARKNPVTSWGKHSKVESIVSAVKRQSGSMDGRRQRKCDRRTC